jgi:O-antigen/teichoic acid export membrane protein
VAYEAIRAKVRQQGSENINRTLTLHLSFVRLTRAGIINFFLIAAGMFSFGGSLALAGIMPLLLSLLCVLGWRGVYRGYYRRMAYAYQEITGQPVDDSLFKE